MRCKNCGAEYSDELEKCPYCNSLNHASSHINLSKRLIKLIDNLFGLKAQAFQSVRKLILQSLLSSIVIVSLCILIGYLFSIPYRVNYYNDPKYDQETYDNLVWEEENIDKLNNAYKSNDFETLIGQFEMSIDMSKISDEKIDDNILKRAMEKEDKEE